LQSEGFEVEYGEKEWQGRGVTWGEVFNFFIREVEDHALKERGVTGGR
jgi:hypothetical protein